MDAKRESYIRDLIDTALRTEEESANARTAFEKANVAHERSVIKRREAAITLQSELRGTVIRYGSVFISVELSGDGPRVRVQPVEEIDIIAPPATSPPPPPAPPEPPKPPMASPPNPKPPNAPPLSGGKVPNLNDLKKTSGR